MTCHGVSVVSGVFLGIYSTSVRSVGFEVTFRETVVVRSVTGISTVGVVFLEYVFCLFGVRVPWVESHCCPLRCLQTQPCEADGASAELFPWSWNLLRRITVNVRRATEKA